MDAKSLAKSKRAHSQHHNKKHHPNQKSKGTASPVGASSTEKAPEKGIKEKPHPSQGSVALPSNWDRYEDEYDLGTENPSHDHMSQPSDIVVPKSKGADYAHLISEAKSQYQTSSSSVIFPSFDDVLSDFDQGLGSFLFVRGQSILSWIENDNFVVEDKATTSHEASFLSLDLHTLAEQLAKVDLSKRLFIEADLLPPELCSGKLQESHNSCQDQATCGNEDSNREKNELSAYTLTDREKHADQYLEFTSSDTTISHRPNQDLNNEGAMSTMPQPTIELNASSVAKQSKLFEADSAEAELDMLLGSFSEAKLLDSPGLVEKPGYTSYLSQAETSTSSLGGASNEFLVKKGTDLSASPIDVDIDDTLDDLLQETSSLIDQTGASLSHVVSSHSSRPTSKSKVLDDFDSWLDTI